ncbi:MAG: methyltransferase domain-containing protein [Gemmatimonadales bacterium]
MAFDEAVVTLAMFTIPDPLRALDELSRVLRPGGVLRMLEHVRIDQPSVVGKAQDFLTPVWRRLAGGCHLNRRPIQSLVAARFRIQSKTAHLGGYIEAITAGAPP